MIGWLCTVHRHRVQYPNNPEASKEIQAQLNKASNLICLAYVWAILDEQGFNEHNHWIRPRDRLELKAWKHIRHTGAHAPGGRAMRYRDEFNEFMASDGQGLSGLKQNCTFTENSLDLRDGMNYRFFQFVQELVRTAIGHCANNNEPVDH
ncbi:MAG: hypothetical protein OEY77_07405 [Nitrospira sp.]|nr:hypothetical protein [Nitrospira sp.]